MSADRLSLLPWLLAAAFVEEPALRALLHEPLLRLAALQPRAGWPGLSVANLITALIFGLAHGLLRAPWLGVATVPAALLIGVVYERWRRLWPCVLCHAAMNGVWWLIA